jgi:hypothetical protein
MQESRRYGPCTFRTLVGNRSRDSFFSGDITAEDTEAIYYCFLPFTIHPPVIETHYSPLPVQPCLYDYSQSPWDHWSASAAFQKSKPKLNLGVLIVKLPPLRLSQ